MLNRPERIYVYNEPRGELAIDLKPGNADEPPDTEYIRADVARAIERDAVRIMREWVSAKDAKFAATWADYERAAMRLDAAEQAMREYLGRMK